MSSTTMMNVVSILMTLVLQPVVLVLWFFCDPLSCLPPDWLWARYLAQSLQYVLLLAWLWHLAGLKAKLERSPVVMKLPPINIRLKQNQDEEEEKPMPLMVLGQKANSKKTPTKDGSPRWLNVLIEQIWVNILPMVEDYVEDCWPLIRKKVKKLPGNIDLLLTNTFCLGREPPRIEQIQVQSKDRDDTQLIVDVEMSWVSNLSVDILIGADLYPFGQVPASLHSFSVRVQARLVLTDLTGELPPVKTIECSLLEVPEVQWDLGGAASIANISYIEHGLKNLIKEQLNKFVLPNKIVIPVVASSKPSDLNIPRPRGYVKLTVVKCRGLERNHSWIEKLVGIFKSSTFIQVTLGGEIFQSEEWVKRTHPVALFNFTSEIPVENPEGRILHLRVKDDMLREKTLASREVHLSQVVSGHESELQWRGLCGNAALILMSTRWCPVMELTEGEEKAVSGVLSFTVLSVLSQEEIVPAISLALTDPGLAEVQYRHSWKSTSIPREAAAREFHLGAGNRDFDLAIHGGGMLRFSADQQELEVRLQDKLTEKKWSQTVNRAEMKSPQTFSLQHQEDQSDVVDLCMKFKIFSDI